MATPDLSNLASSAQIFAANHTLPQIRATHKALLAQIDDKAARLRAQVGGSYRELLGTADTIVAMRVDMDAVQTTLGRMGGLCGRAVVGGKVAGLGRFVKEREDVNLDTGGGLGMLARAKLLEGCALVVEKVLRTQKEGGSVQPVSGAAVSSGTPKQKSGPGRGERLVIAAKVLVLSRLLSKSFGDEIGDPSVRAAVETAQKRLGSLRRKLLRSVERVIESIGDQVVQTDLLEALSAYSLATSSGSRDVLRHFLHIRAKAMALIFEINDNVRTHSLKDVLRCLGLYTKTVLDVQLLIPHKLTEALLRLKKGPLLADESLRRIEGLRLDVYERWCGDEIQYYTPFIRHDDLDGKQAKEMLTGWASKGSDAVLQGLEHTLGSMAEFKAIVELRTKVLKLWISEGGKAKGFDPAVLLDKLRDSIKEHMLEVIDTKVNKLRLVGSEVFATLDGWQKRSPNKHLGLWDEDSFDMELSNGAAQLTQDVISRLYGRDELASRAITSYRSWYQVIEEVGQVVEQLKRQRWDSDIDDIEEEEVIEHRQKLLSKDDPQMLHDHLEKSLAKAFAALDDQLTTLWHSHEHSSSSGPIAMYIARILRDVRSRLPELDEVKGFGLKIVPSLHERIALTVLSSPLESLSEATLAQKAVVGRSLWEGDPELPTSPSAIAFKLLRDISVSMDKAGMDLWSPAAVATLKQRLVQQLLAVLNDNLARRAAQDAEASANGEKNGNPEKDTNGTETAAQEEETAVSAESKSEETAAEKASSEEDESADADALREALAQQRDLYIQWLYDLSYLRCSLITGSTGSETFAKPEQELYQRVGLDGDGDAIQQRLAKSSQDYWKRTSLLFALLA